MIIKFHNRLYVLDMKFIKLSITINIIFKKYYKIHNFQFFLVIAVIINVSRSVFVMPIN